MATVEGTILIRGDRAAIFDLSQDYSLRARWDPFVREYRLVDGASGAAPGAKIWVRARNGLAMTVEVTTLRRPDVVAMRMVDGPWFLERFAGSWRFADADDGRTAVTFRYGFTSRLGPLGRLADPAICAVFRRDVDARLAGLRRGVEENGLLDAPR